MIVFAGHNEFQARFGWSRNVSHYVEEGANSPLAVLDRVRSLSAACKLILTTMDLYYGEAAPDPRITRKLVDHPVCSASEHGFLRDDFQLRLDALAEYCTRIGCLPILIMPGSNDGSFEPSRSILAGSVPAEERAVLRANSRRFGRPKRSTPRRRSGHIGGWRCNIPSLLRRTFALAGCWPPLEPGMKPGSTSFWLEILTDCPCVARQVFEKRTGSSPVDMVPFWLTVPRSWHGLARTEFSTIIFITMRIMST